MVKVSCPLFFHYSHQTDAKQMLLLTDRLLTSFLSLGDLNKCLCLSFMYAFIYCTTETLFYHHCSHWAVTRPPLVDPLLSLLAATALPAVA